MGVAAGEAQPVAKTLGGGEAVRLGDILRRTRPIPVHGQRRTGGRARADTSRCRSRDRRPVRRARRLRQRLEDSGRSSARKIRKNSPPASGRTRAAGFRARPSPARRDARRCASAPPPARPYAYSGSPAPPSASTCPARPAAWPRRSRRGERVALGLQIEEGVGRVAPAPDIGGVHARCRGERSASAWPRPFRAAKSPLTTPI